MPKRAAAVAFLAFFITHYAGAQDSISIRIRPEYDSVGKWRRMLFGENYRKEYAAEVTVPIIRISEIYGGLTPVRAGGGNQTISLRLKDKNGQQWVLRNLLKNPDALIPTTLRQTFVRDVLDDFFSAQHPFAPLIVPVLADAAKVPHANPIIGLVAPDTALGEFVHLFANRVALLEEREPLGNSDNSIEMMDELRDDNDNSYNAQTFLRARLLDLLLGDWDRHPDQWRWVDTKKGKGKFYEPVPRDRDQALFTRQGFFPWLASRPAFLPTLEGFDDKIKRVKYSLIKTNFVNGYMASQFTLDEWMQITNEFVQSITDSVIDAAFSKLPPEIYAIRGKELSDKMKARRDRIPAAMKRFYRFINKKVDVLGTHKHEYFEITDTADNKLKITARKKNSNGRVLFSNVYDPSVTKEVRIYLRQGNDTVVVNNASARTKLRIVGGVGEKSYSVVRSRKPVRFYEKDTSYVPVNLYNITIPLFTAGYNLDDGIIFGAGFKHTHHGFRKLPYASTQQLMAARAFSTSAFRITYRGEWLKLIGNTDFLLNAIARAPDNTQNFFGRGNATVFNKTGDFRRFYRTRFAIYQLDPAFRWRWDSSRVAFSVGPSLQFYRYDADENPGRLISFPSLIGSYDSAMVEKNREHLGIVMKFWVDRRNNKIFPSSGSSFRIRLKGYAGMNRYSKSFVQVMPEASFYLPMNKRGTIVVAERLGGGISLGKTAFYQSLFVGGHDNLLGYRQYRFAGQHSLYNNFELRVKLADFASYILPGQLGMTSFFDLGRVWEENDNSGEWHAGVGGGFYFAPAHMVVLQLVAGYSKEGWLPYFTMGFRF